MEVMKGVVVFWTIEKWHGLIRLADAYNDYTAHRGNPLFFVRGSSIVPDERGSRYLRVGEHVEFVEDTDPPPDKNKNQDCLAKRCAKDVKALGRAPLPDDYSEDCTVLVVMKRWNTEPVCGWAKRPDGDSLFWHKNDVTTDGLMEVGMRFNCVPVPNQNGASSRWQASLIEIYKPEGDNSDGHEHD
jgi:hypothetical protein